MNVGASLKRTVGQWFEAFGARETRAVGDLIESPLPARRYAPPACDLCGRRLLLGEPLNRFHKDDGTVVVCPVCEPEALLVGYVRLPADGDPARWYVADGQVARVQHRPQEALGATSLNAAAAGSESLKASGHDGRRRRRLKAAA